MAAGLDVFEHEPYNGPLAKLPNAVLTPHMGSAAKECRGRMEREAAENLIEVTRSRWVEMLGENDRRGEILGERRHEDREGINTTGRRADDDQM